MGRVLDALAFGMLPEVRRRRPHRNQVGRPRGDMTSDPDFQFYSCHATTTTAKFFRICKDPNPSTCAGPAKRFTSCNLQPCPGGYRDADSREAQCARLVCSPPTHLVYLQGTKWTDRLSLINENNFLLKWHFLTPKTA